MVTPRAYWSAAPVTVFDDMICSGAMYAGVPRAIEAVVRLTLSSLRLAMPKSTIFGTGSASLAANDLVLNVTRLPLNSFGYFFRGTSTVNTLLAGGGLGTNCVGGTVASGVGGAIVSSGTTGTVSLLANLTALPSAGGPVPATVGQTLWLQYWYRDVVGGAATSNLSNGLQVKVGL